ncbi:hypothetical protein YTPLAS73_08750 [Nitrosarchaeum sp.]|nr:hypothetical protein YTPLAS73_08750 [Nitrosarchaeum sp.]
MIATIINPIEIFASEPKLGILPSRSDWAFIPWLRIWSYYKIRLKKNEAIFNHVSVKLFWVILLVYAEIRSLHAEFE